MSRAGGAGLDGTLCRVRAGAVAEAGRRAHEDAPRDAGGRVALPHAQGLPRGGGAARERSSRSWRRGAAASGGGAGAGAAATVAAGGVAAAAGACRARWNARPR